MDIFLHYCYSQLINENMIGTITEIITGCYPNSKSYNWIDEFIICQIAVQQNMYHLVEMLLDCGFDLNHYFLTPSSRYRCMDILSVAVKENNLNMCKFLIDKGTNPLVIHCHAINESCRLKDDTIFDYFLELDMDSYRLTSLLFSAANFQNDITTLDYSKIKKLLEKGLDFAKADFEMLSIMISRCKIKDLQFLLDNGLVIKSNAILFKAIYRENKGLVDFLLEYGLEIDNQMLNKIFKLNNFSIILFLAEIDVDLSTSQWESKYEKQINILMDKGLKKDVLINYLAEYASTFNTMNHSYFFN